ncbi:exonuclease domain-containing protein [Streptomyces sp. NRRL F-5123]|uniref:exonuclease domain-containing protein n=1 Tax=Streptomyces sp. NRRL F-5123 TaxID=1463856 RepID=UPI0004E156CD|nr:exonuclease domain-containing protein [Streptomyces sp. NRRL F-5123]
MKFIEMRRGAWDTETTGPDPTTARIVTAAFMVRGGGRDDTVMSWVINPGVPVPDEAAEIHGYTTERVQAEGQDPAVALDEIASRLTAAIGWGMPLVAFNHSFDWSVLHYDLQRNNLPTVADRVGPDAVLPLLDPHVIDKQMDRYVRGTGMRKLKPTAERYGVELEDWHTAEADALAALLIAEAQFDGRYARLGEVWDRGPAAMFEAQQKWRADQQASLAAWFTGRGEHETAASVRTEWPLIPAAGGVA